MGRAELRIVRSKDCGNSPKNKFVENFVVAIAEGDEGFIKSALAADVEWHAIGRKPIHGAQAVATAILRGAATSRIEIEHVVTHGRAGAINGVVEFGEKLRYFCHMYEFANAKGISIRKLTSYSIARR